jgi:hypothetical protein
LFHRNFRHEVGTSGDPWKFQHSSDRGSSGVAFFYRRNFRQSLDLYIPIGQHLKTLTYSFKHHRCLHLSPLNLSRGNQVSIVGFCCFGFLWILHSSEHPILITSSLIRVGNLQGISFKIRIAWSLNVEGS